MVLRACRRHGEGRHAPGRLRRRRVAADGIPPGQPAEAQQDGSRGCRQVRPQDWRGGRAPGECDGARAGRLERRRGPKHQARLLLRGPGRVLRRRGQLRSHRREGHAAASLAGRDAGQHGLAAGVVQAPRRPAVVAHDARRHRVLRPHRGAVGAGAHPSRATEPEAPRRDKSHTTGEDAARGALEAPGDHPEFPGHAREAAARVGDEAQPHRGHGFQALGRDPRRPELRRAHHWEGRRDDPRPAREVRREHPDPRDRAGRRR
mmetsp:Transcript_69720/g.196678  ORF Transcript_69720/g.196678 Transcript_69720/m.196678 type:complete len:262 (+) Transcript_69720:177-962(+)